MVYPLGKRGLKMMHVDMTVAQHCTNLVDFAVTWKESCAREHSLTAMGDRKKNMYPVCSMYILKQFVIFRRVLTVLCIV